MEGKIHFVDFIVKFWVTVSKIYMGTRELFPCLHRRHKINVYHQRGIINMHGKLIPIINLCR